MSQKQNNTSYFPILESSFSFDKSFDGSGEESLTIFNESDSNPWNSRGGTELIMNT